MNKKGTVVDIMLTPTFVTIIAIGIVLVSLLGAVYKLGQAEDYTTRFYSMDIALLLDSLQAVPKGVNLQLDYVLPPQHGLEIEPTKVTTISSVTKSFYFTEDLFYSMVRTKYAPTESSKTYTFYRAGNNVGVTTDNALNLHSYYCEQTNYRLAFTPTQNTIGSTQTELITGGILVTGAQESSADSQINIYINTNPASEHIACTIAKQLSTLYQVPVSIIPVNPTFLPEDDDLMTLNSLKPTLHVQVKGLPATTQTQTALTHAIKQGVIPHAQ